RSQRPRSATERGKQLVQMLSTTGNRERAGTSEKIQPQINAKADANR
ncbi:MAG: hypothetical protein, partial [Olavius algarvensis Gamma 1 endosymbiont]